ETPERCSERAFDSDSSAVAPVLLPPDRYCHLLARECLRRHLLLNYGQVGSQLLSCRLYAPRASRLVACKKANRSNLTSPSGPKASRRKTFDLSNRGQQTAQRGNSRAGQFFLKV